MAKAAKSADKGTDWYGKGAGEDAAAPAETVAERHKRERSEAFKRHDTEMGDTRTRQTSELEDMMDRHVREVGITPEGSATAPEKPAASAAPAAKPAPKKDD